MSGSLWKRFRGGTQLDPRLLKDEGLRVLLPWDKLFLYDLRLQTTTDTYNAISKDGVNLTATINIRFRLKHDAVPQLHQSIGPDYMTRMLRPEIGNRAREIIAEYTAEEVYSTQAAGNSEAHPHATPRRCWPEHDRSGPSRRANTASITGCRWTRCSSSTTRWCSAWSCRRPSSPRSTARSSSIIWSQEYGFRVDRERKESERKQIEAQRHPRLPADGDAGHFGFLRALARHRGDAAACAVAEHQDRHHRQRQGRPAGHPRQRRRDHAARRRRCPPILTRRPSTRPARRR